MRTCASQTLIAIYIQARRPERLEWASQACLEAGKEIPDVYIGLAAALEQTNHDAEALQILNNAVGKFDKSSDIYYHMAQLFKRNKRDEEAGIALIKAVALAPQNGQLTMDALEHFSAIQKWTEARQMADKLKYAQTDNPEVKLVIARALQKGGDLPGAQAVVIEARALIGKKPAEVRETIERAYADVLNAGAPASVIPHADLPPATLMKK